MPDFHLPERRATLVFEDGDLKGLELEVRLSLPFDTLFRFQSLAASASEGSSLEAMRDLLQLFADEGLLSWNLSNGKGPVPLSEFTAHVDPINGGRMLARYLAAVGGLPGPLARRSRSGRTSKAPPVSRRRKS